MCWKKCQQWWIDHPKHMSGCGWDDGSQAQEERIQGPQPCRFLYMCLGSSATYVSKFSSFQTLASGWSSGTSELRLQMSV